MKLVSIFLSVLACVTFISADTYIVDSNGCVQPRTTR